MGSFDTLWATNLVSKLASIPQFQSQYKAYEMPNWLTYYEKTEMELFQIITQPLAKTKIFRPLEQYSSVAQALDSIEDLQQVFEKAGRSQTTKIMADFLPFLVPFVLAFKCAENIFECRLQYNQSISELIKASKANDQAAFLKLVAIDLTFLCTDFARTIVALSELNNDRRFKTKLAEAISSRRFRGSRKNKRAIAALDLLSGLGYEDRPYSQWAEFLTRHGFPQFADIGNVSKTVKRYKIPKKHPKSRKKLDS